MASSQTYLETLFRVGSFAGLPDGALLERFIAGPPDIAEVAFTALVERHGAMVRRSLPAGHRRLPRRRGRRPGDVPGPRPLGPLDPVDRLALRLALRRRLPRLRAGERRCRTTTRPRTAGGRTRRRRVAPARALARGPRGTRPAPGTLPPADRPLLPGRPELRAGRPPTALSRPHPPDPPGPRPRATPFPTGAPRAWPRHRIVDRDAGPGIGLGRLGQGTVRLAMLLEHERRAGDGRVGPGVGRPGRGGTSGHDHQQAEVRFELCTARRRFGRGRLGLDGVPRDTDRCREGQRRPRRRGPGWPSRAGSPGRTASHWPARRLQVAAPQDPRGGRDDRSRRELHDHRRREPSVPIQAPDRRPRPGLEGLLHRDRTTTCRRRPPIDGSVPAPTAYFTEATREISPTLDMDRGSVVTGRIVREGKPVPGEPSGSGDSTSSESPEVKADAEGRFRFPTSPPIRRAGPMSPRGAWSEPARSVQVAADRRRRFVDRRGRHRGRARPDGLRPGGLRRRQASCPPMPKSSPRPITPADVTGKPDRSGRFTLTGLPAGLVSIAVLFPDDQFYAPAGYRLSAGTSAGPAQPLILMGRVDRDVADLTILSSQAPSPRPPTTRRSWRPSRTPRPGRSRECRRSAMSRRDPGPETSDERDNRRPAGIVPPDIPRDRLDHRARINSHSAGSSVFVTPRDGPQ